jgi:hypothetical protein
VKNRIWSNALFIASCVPSVLLTAFILWFMLVARPSGQEQWGDSAIIFHLAAWTYSISLALIVAAIVLGVRWRRAHPNEASAGPLLFITSLALLFAPIITLFVVSPVSGP